MPTAQVDSTTSVQPDAADTERFLRALGDMRVQLLAIHADHGPRRVEQFTLPQDIAAAVQWAVQWNMTGTGGVGIYFSAAEVAPGWKKKAAKADLTHLHMAHGDLDPDIKQHGDYATARAKLLNGQLDALRGAQLAPSMLVDSGNGLVALWLLDPALLASENIGALEAVNRGICAAWNGDVQAVNADRVLRLPGTVNWPSQSKLRKGYPAVPSLARLLELHDRTYTLEELAAAYPVPQSQQQMVAASGQAASDPVMGRAEDLDAFEALVRAMPNDDEQDRNGATGMAYRVRCAFHVDPARGRDVFLEWASRWTGGQGSDPHEDEKIWDSATGTPQTDVLSLLRKAGKLGVLDQVPGPWSYYFAKDEFGYVHDDSRPSLGTLGLVDMLRRFALLSTDPPRVVDLAAVDPQHASMTLATFRQTCRRKMPQTGQGRPPLVTAVWLDHAKRQTLRGLGFFPGQPDSRVVRAEGEDWYNTFAFPDHPNVVAPTALQTFEDLLEHLMPELADRDFVRAWIACKLQRPAVRGPVTLMVAQTQGTGRGTLFELITALVGAGNADTQPLATVIGAGNSGLYDDHLQSLFLHVPESRDASTDKLVYSAYEHLKSMFDPGSSMRTLNLKGRPKVRAEVCTSLFMASNNTLPLVIPSEDRRVYVIKNRETKLPSVLRDRVSALLRDRAGLGALFWHLKKMPLGGYDPFAPAPMTAAKRELLDSARSPRDEIFDLAVEQLDGDVVTSRQLLKRMHQLARADENYEDLTKYLNGRLRHRPGEFRRPPPLPGQTAERMVRVPGGKKLRPWIARNWDRWKDADNQELARELNKNESPTPGPF